MKKHKAWIVGGALLSFGVLCLIALKQNSGEAAVERFASALSHRDWATIYDLAPVGELKDKGVSKDSFVSLCTSLGGNLPSSYFERISNVENKKVSESAKAGHVFRTVTLDNVPHVEGRSCTMSITAAMTTSGWKVLANEIPIRLSRMHKLGDRERAKNLLDAMREAGLASYPVSDRVVFYETGISRYVSGNFGPGEMTKS